MGSTIEGTHVMWGTDRPWASDDRAASASDDQTSPSKQRTDRSDKPIRIVLVDDHALMREGIRSVLMMYPGLDVVAEAADGLQAVEVVAAALPDIVLMDVNMPRMNGIEATRRITSLHPSIKVIALTVHDDETLAQAMRAAGAADYATKGSASESLVRLIRATVE